MTELRELNYFLGLEVHRQNGNYSISVESYIERVGDVLGYMTRKLQSHPWKKHSQR